MRSSRWLLFACVLPACSLYGPDLFDGQSVDGSGGKPSSDGGSETGGENGSGGKGNTGGENATGGKTNGGGTGGGSSGGGRTGGGGGVASGGAGGGGSGGTPSGGGSGTGGGMGGDPGTGGTPDPGCTEAPCLIDDLDHEGNIGYYNKPFRGQWSRYIQRAPAAWASSTTPGMIQERSDEAGNFAMHIAATGLDDWGLGVLVTLSNGSPIDLRAYTSLTFWVRSVGTETSLAVALADEHSHQPACTDIDPDDCDQHVRHAPSIAMTSSWKKVTLDLVDFVDVGNQGRVEPVDLRQVYAIHFQMDPTDDVDGVDFWVDELIFE